jgi:putative hemolysin
MQENGEIFQKYCAHIGGRVTVFSGEGGKLCLSSHLCHGQKCEERKFNTALGSLGACRVDINQKQE